MNLLAKNAGNLDMKVILRDLFVVALGILIAIWVDGWVNDRADRREEQQILIGLRAEFQANREQLERVSKTWRDAKVASEQLILMTGSETNDADIPRIRNLAADLSNYRTFDPRSGQLKSVISSGKLSLVSNSDLRAGLADWPDLVADMMNDFRFIDNFHYEKQFATLNQAVPLRPDSSLEPNLNGLFQDVGFENWLLDLSIVWTYIVDETDEIMAATDEIIDLIDAELR
jgi:hypothetical protein